MNEKYKCLPPEVMYTDTLYAFSFNPEDQPTGAGAGVYKLNAIKDFHIEIADKFHKLHNCEVEIVPELSRNGRWHYHGTILIKHVIKFFVYDMPKLKLMGTYEIDSIESQTKWDEYVFKQKHYMQPYMREEGAPYMIRGKQSVAKIVRKQLFEDS